MSVELVLSLYKRPSITHKNGTNEVFVYAQSDLTYTRAPDKVVYKRAFEATRYTPLQRRSTRSRVRIRMISRVALLVPLIAAASAAPEAR